jgi:hypothetical protein
MHERRSTVLKKVVFAVVAGSLAIGTQIASADDTQFDAGGGRYQGVAALPFVSPAAMRGDGAAVTPTRLEDTHASATRAPAPYNMSEGYFN